MTDKQKRANVVAGQLEHFAERLRSGEYEPEAFRLEQSSWLEKPSVEDSRQRSRPGPHTTVQFTEERSGAMSQVDMFGPEDDLPTSLPKSDPHVTLRQAQRVLADNLDHGTVCRCCGQYAKRYRRKLTSGLAYALIYINRGVVDGGPWMRGDWIHVENLFKAGPHHGLPAPRGGDYAKLRFWGLLEKKAVRRDDGSSRGGLWKVTAKGRNFLNHLSVEPSYAVVYNGICEGLGGKTINIEQALGRKFNYQELMRGE
jgi:hypothetical protein